MPKGGNKNRIDPKSIATRVMLDKAPQLCTSQIYNELYDKLYKNFMVDRFVAVVQHCSVKGMTIEETISTLKAAFPSYINDDELTRDVFVNMLEDYPEVSFAWGYGQTGDEISKIIVKNKALKLVEKTDNMEDIQMYQDMFGVKQDESVDKSTSFNFNLFGRNTDM